MFEMNDEVAFVQLAEIDLGAVAAEPFRALQTPPAVSGVAPEQFRAGKDDQLAVGKTEAARQSAFEQVDLFDRLAHDLAEPLDLAFGLEINDDAKSARAPIPQASGELRALRLDQHEIAHGEIADVALVERAAEIFRFVAAEPAFADQDIRRAVRSPPARSRLEGDPAAM